MKTSSKIFLAAFIVGFFRVMYCGSIFAVGYGNTELLNENYGLCVLLIVVMVGLVAYGAVLFFKERKSNLLQNKIIVDKKNELYGTDGKKIPIIEGNISEKKRLPPTKETLRKLLKKSGNDCQFQPCPNVMIDHNGYLQGHVVSIMSNEKTQPNYNPSLSDVDRIKIDNLMLLCHDHFFEVKLHEKHTIDALLERKVEAEEAPNRDQSFEIKDEIIDDLILGYIERYL